MFTHTIKYTDFLGVEREEDFRFHLSKAELMRMEMNEYGGLQSLITKIVKEQDTKKIYEMFEELITNAYGEISPDGVSFVKDEKKLKRFMESPAYSELIMKMLEDEEFANKFIKGCFPKDIQDKMENEDFNKDKIVEFPKKSNNPIPAPSINNR